VSNGNRQHTEGEGYIESRGYEGYDDYPGPRDSAAAFREVPGEKLFSGRPGLGAEQTSHATDLGFRAYQDYSSGEKLQTMAVNGEPGKRRTDDAILNEVFERLRGHYEVNPCEIDIEVKNSVVYLGGRVESRASKRIAEAIVSQINGVEEVHNRLRVGAKDELMSDYRPPEDSTDSSLKR
jgi:osmotically-inducible protein OsmY